MALRWRKDAPQRGLARIGAGPRGSCLFDGEVEYASVSALRRHHSVQGWYWVVAGKLPYKNTCNAPSPTEAEAKSAAMAYVRACIKAQEGTK